MKEDQDNLCSLPKEIGIFVGREHETKESKELLLKGEKFLIITGGPCYGKSSLANDIGHSLFKKPFNYVIQIGMRDITSSTPTLKDVAQNILKGFQIDTTEMQNEIVNFLIRKFESITTSGKKALVIFDNADNLIAQQEDKTCQSTTYKKLCNIIHSNSRESSIRCIFTTRVCNDLEQNNDDHCIIKLDRISDEESKEFIRIELADVTGFDMEQSIEKLVSISYGLPMALQLICSTIKNLENMELIKGYIENLRRDTFEAVAKFSNLEGLLALSLKYLDNSDKELLFLVAAFPSRFSYRYTKMLTSFVKNDERNLEVRMQNLEDHSLIQDDSRGAGTSDDKLSRGKFYTMHPLFCEYIRKKHWADEMYKTSYYKLYLRQLFSLGGRALEKDKYVDCLREYQAEQHNYFDVMAQIGKSSEQINQSSHLQETFRKELERMTTPDYIATYLFCVDMTSPSLLHKYFEGCMALANEDIKKDIWCCLYDLNMKCYEKKIDDPSNELEPGNYGRALLDKRNVATKIYNSYMNKTIKKDFHYILEEIEALEERAETLECMKMKAYFKHKALKSKGDWLKKSRKIKSLAIKEDECIQVYIKSLKVCEENFGDCWLTIDCHNQLGKTHWRFNYNQEATHDFDNAIRLAESMSLTKNKKFGSCLLDKGRFLIDSGDEQNMEKGKILLEDFITRCKDVTDTTFWCRAMQYLCIVDRSYFELAKDTFFQIDELNSAAMYLMEDVLMFDLKFSDKTMDKETLWERRKSMASVLGETIAHVEKMVESSGENCDDNDNNNNDTSLVKGAKKHIFSWQKRAALYYAYVVPLDERKQFAEKAVRYIENSSTSIENSKKEDLQSVANQASDPEDMKLLQVMHYITFVGKHALQEGKDDEVLQRCFTLLKMYENDQKIWSLLVLRISTNNPVFYDGVTALLVCQSEPCEDLLKLVDYNFYYKTRMCDRTADENVIVQESLKAVDQLEEAIEYVAKLLRDKSLLPPNVIERLNVSISSWYKCIALHTSYCISYRTCVSFADQALKTCTNLNKKERKKLTSFQSREYTVKEHEKVGQKVLLMKVAKFMLKNGMQDKLEKKYDAFLADCSSYPRIRFDMIKFILRNKYGEISKLTKYLSYLPQHFKDESLKSSWDYQFIIDLADELFSDQVDQSSRAKNFEIYWSIYTILCSSNMRPDLRRKLEFEFLVIFSLKTGKDIIDDKKKQKYAEDALSTFAHVGSYSNNDKLLGYKEQLERLIGR